MHRFMLLTEDTVMSVIRGPTSNLQNEKYFDNYHASEKITVDL